MRSWYLVEIHPVMLFHVELFVIHIRLKLFVIHSPCAT
jgi:hypothetical protein